jgi:hypothetical protein
VQWDPQFATGFESLSLLWRVANWRYGAALMWYSGPSRPEKKRRLNEFWRLERFKQRRSHRVMSSPFNRQSGTGVLSVPLPRRLALPRFGRGDLQTLTGAILSTGWGMGWGISHSITAAEFKKRL